MASEFRQVSSCVAKGWDLRDFPVNVWYLFSAALNIAVKLSVEGPVEDIGTAKGNWEVCKSCMKIGRGQPRGLTVAVTRGVCDAFTD